MVSERSLRSHPRPNPCVRRTGVRPALFPGPAAVLLPGRAEDLLPGPAAALLSGLAAVLLALTLAARPATAQEIVDPGLTVYMQNTALVRATVDRPVQPGERTVRVDGLPGNVDPGSLVVLDPEATLLGVHGRRSYQAAGEDGAVSLALDLRVERPLERLRLAYLTQGMSWSPSYAMVVTADDASARIDGYATLSNNSGTGYRDASVQLLAGTVNVEGGRDGPRPMALAEMRVAADAAARAPQLSREAFSGYHLYDVDVPITLHAGASRRIRLLGAGSVPVEREHVLAGQVNVRQQMREPQREEAFIRYRVERPEGTSFADLPLPGGTVRMYRPDDRGRLQLVGADGIQNTPAGEELFLTVGRAFDIGGTRTQTDHERPGSDVYESAWRIDLVNRSDERVEVQVIEQIEGDWEITESSHDAERLSASRVRFDVAVPADGEASLTYRVRVRT